MWVYHNIWNYSFYGKRKVLLRLQKPQNTFLPVHARKLVPQAWRANLEYPQVYPRTRHGKRKKISISALQIWSSVGSPTRMHSIYPSVNSTSSPLKQSHASEHTLIFRHFIEEAKSVYRNAKQEYTVYHTTIQHLSILTQPLKCIILFSLKHLIHGVTEARINYVP